MPYETLPNGRLRRGFAAMSPAKRAAIASLGGKASHAKGTGHEWTQDEARAAGRKGGLVSRGGRGRAAPAEPQAVSCPRCGGSDDNCPLCRGYGVCPRTRAEAWVAAQQKASEQVLDRETEGT